LALALAGALLWQASAHAQTHRAALVVQHGSDWPGVRLVLKCVEFAADAINGLTLLELAGVNSGQPPQVYDWGAGAYSVCQVDREPRQVPDRCFGPTSGANWSDWSASASGWVARSSGTSGYLIHDGDTEGWTYTSAFGAPPPSIRFSQVCASSTTPTPPAALTHPPVALPITAPSESPTRTPAPLADAPQILPTERAALTSTGPPPPPSRSSAVPAWFFLAATTILLLGLGAINLRRRGP
jgi:hypothetical protein